jgi:hypothetical protein
MIPKNSWIGWAPNTYAMPEKCDYCLLSGTRHQFEEPNGEIGPKWNGHGDIVGCGLLLSADHKLAIFFTNNGVLMGQLSYINKQLFDLKFVFKIHYFLTSLVKKNPIFW